MNDIDINKEKLMKDLGTMCSVFSMFPPKDVIKNDYAEFTALNNAFGKMFFENFNLRNLFRNPKEVQKMMDRYRGKAFNRFLDYAAVNKNTLLELFGNYSSMIDEIDFQDIPFYDVMKYYSKKDFIDIILSFFNTFGEKYYKIAKKYFDEERIQMKFLKIEKDYLNMMLDMCKTEEEKENVEKNYGIKDDFAGFFSSIVLLSSGYILSRFNKFNSFSATSIVHELGHAVDAETFIFPQQKNMAAFSDMMQEVPSTSFELNFLDYLIDNRIDVDGGMVIMNDRNAMIDDTYEGLKTVYDEKQVDFDVNGSAIIDEKRYDFKEDILYGLGYYFALCLNIIKNQDKNEYLKILNNIMTMRNESTLDELIEMTGIDYDDFISGKFVRPKVESEYLKLRKRFNV